MQKGTCPGNATRNNKLDFGDFGLQVMDRGPITNIQIEAARVAANRHMKRRGQMWIRIFPHKSYTKKPLEVRMGKGKGNVEGWVAVVKPGNIVMEVSGVPESIAREALALASSKLPYRCKFLTRSAVATTANEA